MIGNNKIKTFITLGCFFFPSIYRSLEKDNTEELFSLKSTEIPSECYFECIKYIFESVSCGVGIDLCRFDVQTFSGACHLIGNEELTNQIGIELLKKAEATNIGESSPFLGASAGAGFIAQHFSSSKEFIIGQGREYVHRIVSHGSLRIEDEDELVSFCVECFKRWHEVEIFESVIFERVSAESMKSFYENVISCLPAESLIPLFPAILRRLLLPVDVDSPAFASSPSHSLNARYVAFDSLVDHFKSQSIPLNATGSTLNGGNAMQALGKGRDKWFQSTDIANSVWQVDFGRNVIIESYVLTGLVGNSHYPKTWEVSVSTDGKQWRSADQQRDQNTSQPGSIFNLKTGTECQYFKITQTGPNGYGYHFLTIGEIDFKGKIKV
jgi:hypothetical protein